jgi:hypothetical protein
MSLIKAVLALGKIDLPDGLQPGLFEVTLTTAGQSDVVKTTDTTEITFDGLAPGDYTVSACRLADSGERLSEPVSDSITVPAPSPTQIDVPASITLTLG